MDPEERKFIQEEYDIRKETYSPSIYGKSQLKFRHNNQLLTRSQGGEYRCVHVELDTRDRWMQQILNEVLQCVDVESRAVLVFFETQEVLSEFVATEYGQRLVTGKNAKVVTEELTLETAQFNLLVANAVTEVNITLLPAKFGRGIDFMCNDRQVNRKGGVHIIQTFLSESLSEEIQIRGRTARQDKTGSYQMLLHIDDLKKFGLESKEVEEAQQGEQKANDGIFQLLVTKRSAFISKQIRKNRARLEDSRQHDRDAKKLRRLLISLAKTKGIVKRRSIQNDIYTLIYSFNSNVAYNYNIGT